MSKKITINIIKAIVGILLFYYIVIQIEFTTLSVILKDIDFAPAILGLLCMGASGIVGSQRWRILMEAQGLNFNYFTTLKWTFIGMFYNTFMPGLTGGDIIKAVYVTKKTSNKTSAVMTVFVDRVTGILGLALVGAIAITVCNIKSSEFIQAKILLYLFLLLAVLIGCVFFSKRIRRFIYFDFIIGKLPFSGIVNDADEAILCYRRHKATVFKAIVLSVCIHVTVIFGVYLFGLALGVSTLGYSYLGVLALIPAVFILSSFAITPAGIGVGESLSIYLLASIGTTTEQALSIMLLFRISQIIWSLLGGLAIIRQR